MAKVTNKTVPERKADRLQTSPPDRGWTREELYGFGSAG